ncbi:MAG TPA: phosphoribosylanthranilate isomerase [Pseudomonadales bacterium]
MARVRIKICGITTPADALAAANAGADAIGLVFYAPSPRVVTLQQAAEIQSVLPPFVTTVGLFVNPEADLVHDALAAVPLDCLQFHGDEAAAFCAGFGRPWIKAIRVSDARSVSDARLKPYGAAQALLLDAADAQVFGGSGRSFDWSLVPGDLMKSVVLAGGLNAANVGEAIRCVRPYAVDVSSGVESAPGKKDATLIQHFVRAVQTESGVTAAS